MTEEQPKKRRKLFIVDIPGDGTTTVGVVPPLPPAPVSPPEPKIEGPGPVHARAQQEVLEMCKKARGDVDDIDPHVWKRVDTILTVKTTAEAEEIAKTVLASAQVHFILTTKHPEKQAKAAERLAKMWRTKGEDEKADAQLAKAKKIRADMAKEVK